jgi:uncharacterized repeat protein (TIGR01451 family)
MFRFSLAVAISAFLFVPSQAAAQSASASIQVSVTQPQPVAAGANFDYVINVSNEGPDDALNMTLTLPLPSGVSFQSVATPAGWSCTNPSVGATGTVTCSAPALAPGTASFTITASTAPNAQTGTYSTTATITSTTPDPSDNDNSAQVDVTISTQSDYGIALMASPDPVTAGSIFLTWTMTVTNNGPSTGTSATVSFPLPAGTMDLLVAAPAGWSCTAPLFGTVTCTLTTSLSPSSQAVISVHTQLDSSTPAGTTLSGTATVSSPDDMFPINDSATASVQTTTLADLAVTMSVAPATDFPGSALQYTINATNNGPSDAAAVTMTDVLPAALRFTSIVAPGGWSCTTPAPGTNGTVTCSLASMPVGSGGTFTLNVVIDLATAAGTNISNTAQISSSTPDANSVNNSSTAQVVVVGPANVTASKSVNGAIHGEGSLVTYTIVLTNTGSIAQGDNLGNELTDGLPSSLTLISATATSGTAVASVGANTVTWNGSIAGGGTVTITIQALVKYGTIGSMVSNQATISYDSDANGTNDASRVSDDPSTIAPNDPTSFQVVGSVPALSQMMLLLLAAALAVMSLIVMRK